MCDSVQHGRLFLVGDAAHTVLLTGDKGLNLAVALGAYYQARDTGLLDAYTQTVLKLVWRAQHFSWWMTSMLHRFPEATGFDLRRQIAQLETVTSCRLGPGCWPRTTSGYP